MSLYLAKKTGVFHASKSCLPKGNMEAECDEAQYNGLDILKCLLHLLHEEIMLEFRFIERAITPVRLFYEDVVGRPQDTLDLFARVILNRKTLDLPSKLEAVPLRRPSAAIIREKFEAEFASQLMHLLRMRPNFSTGATSDEVNSLDFALNHAPYFHVVNALGRGIFAHTNLDITSAKLKVGGSHGTSVPLAAIKVDQSFYAFSLPNFTLERSDGRTAIIVDFGENEYQCVLPRANQLIAFIDFVSETNVSGWLSRFGPNSGVPPQAFLLINGRTSAPVTPSVPTPWSASISNNGGIDGFSLELKTGDIVKDIIVVDEAGEFLCEWKRKA